MATKAKKKTKKKSKKKSKKTTTAANKKKPTASTAKQAPGAFTGFPEVTFAFLRGIAAHNDKAWFEQHRAEYQAGYVDAAASFVAALGPRLQQVAPEIRFEPRVNGSLFRIFRDVRFSKDKSPYKPHLDLWFWAGAQRGWSSPGFYFRMFAGSLMIGVGIHVFERAQLDRYRAAVVDDKQGKALQAAVAKVQQAGYVVGGAERKTVPKGFDKDHPRAALLLHDGLWAQLEGPLPKVVKSEALVDYCVEHFTKMWPLGRALLGL